VYPLLDPGQHGIQLQQGHTAGGRHACMI
jgi:hypothetical protein